MSTTTPAVQSNDINGTVKPVPINLRAVYGGRYKIAWDESYSAQYGANAVVDDPWLQTIPGRHGHIYALGCDQLAVCTNHHGPVAKRLAALKGAKIIADADDGLTVEFPIVLFEKVARIVRARTCRRLTDAQRQRLKEAGEAYRFKKRSTGADGAAPATDK